MCTVAEEEKTIGDLHYSLMREKNKLLFLADVFNGEMMFIDNTDEKKNADILAGLGNVLEDIAVTVNGVVNELEKWDYKTISLTNERRDHEGRKRN